MLILGKRIACILGSVPAVRCLNTVHGVLFLVERNSVHTQCIVLSRENAEYSVYVGLGIKGMLDVVKFFCIEK